MYKQIAAYAAALIVQPGKFTRAIQQDGVVYGISRQGKYMYDDLHMADQLSILGAMRAGCLALDNDLKSYNYLDKAVKRAILSLYPDSTMKAVDLDAHKAYTVLIAVAKG